MKRKALGRGLSAILSDPLEDTAVETSLPAERLRDLPIGRLRANSQQPRHNFDEEALQELAQSIRTHGVLQPLLARDEPDENGIYELIAGERRLRASKMAGLEVVPVVLVEAEEIEALELALVENLQRDDLDPIEEAKAYTTLIEQFGMTQETVAQRMGRSRTAIANTTRLLHLSDKVQELIASGALSAGHGRQLLSIADPEKQLAAAREIIERGLSVRDTEKIAKERSPKKKSKEQKQPETKQDLQLADLERQLEYALKTRVRVKPSASGGGILEIKYFDNDHFTTILRRLNLARDML